MVGDKRVLLIVDDEGFWCQEASLATCREASMRPSWRLSPWPLNVASTKVIPPITHVVCDYFLGNQFPNGSELLAKWRTGFPCIRVAVLLSGSELDAIAPEPGIDWVLSKPPDLGRLKHALGLPS